MRIVLLGTGTAVGKTTAGCALIRSLQGAEPLRWPVLGLKPIETGFAARGDSCPHPASDAAQLEAAAFHVQHPRPHPLYAFSAGVSPHLAAERAGRSIEINRVVEWLTEAELRTGNKGAVLSVIETAGGVFSPLSLSTRNFDLALALRAHVWLLVAPDRLGVLHDVAATASSMTHLGRAPDALVLTQPPNTDASTGSNAPELQRLHPALPVLSLAGQVTPGSAGDRDAASPLRAWLMTRLQS
jgi:dethiobiotin synthetase